jgi:hypothetical protein
LVTQIDSKYICPSTGYVATGVADVDVIFSNLGKRGLPSPGLIKTKLTGSTRGSVRSKVSKSFTNRGVWLKRRGIAITSKPDYLSYLALLWGLHWALLGMTLGNVGIDQLNEKSLIQTFS